MSQKALKPFFQFVSTSKICQDQLRDTRTLTDVVEIAEIHGFHIHAHDILYAQASRLLVLIHDFPDEANKLCAGKSSEFGAQWGRKQEGLLERPGFWLTQCLAWDCMPIALTPMMKACYQHCQTTRAQNARFDCPHVLAFTDHLATFSIEVPAINILHYLALGALLTTQAQATCMAESTRPTTQALFS